MTTTQAKPLTAPQGAALQALAEDGWAVLGMRTGHYGNLVVAGSVADALTSRGYATQAGQGRYTILRITDAGRAAARQASA